MNKTFDRFAGILFLVLGSTFVVESLKISNTAYGSNVGPSVFPLGLGALLVLFSIRLLYETFRYTQQGGKQEKLDYKRFGIIFAAAVLYAYFLESIGYVIATFLFLIVAFQTMKREKLWVSFLIAGVFSAGVYALYVHVLEGTLPGFPSWLGLS